MKMRLLAMLLVLVGVSASWVQSSDTSFLELRCSPSKIVDERHLSKINFCQTSKNEGELRIYRSEAFAQNSIQLIKQSSAQLKLGSQETHISVHSDSLILEASPSKEVEHSWTANFKEKDSSPKVWESMGVSEGPSYEYSCRVAFVSSCGDR